MSHQEFEVNYLLSPEEREQFVNDCERLATDLLGPPNPDIARDARERRLRNGLHINIARTAIRFSEEQVGFLLDLRLFVAEVEVASDPEEAVQQFVGSYLTFHVDLMNRTVKRAEAHGNLAINHVGEDELTLTDVLDGLSTQDEEYVRDEEFDDIFSADRIEASDYLELHDIRQTFFGQVPKKL